MTSDVQTIRRAAPASIEEWLLVLKMAGKTVVRAIALVAVAIILARVRSDASIPFHVAMAGVALGCLYVALGNGFKDWAPYVVGFILFAQLRARADDLGMPVQYTYPIVAEKVFFLGTLPNNWLQDAFYSYKHLGFLETYTIVTYVSYFFVPHIVAIALWKWDRERFKTFSVAFLVTLYIGLIVCTILPTAPPWLAAQEGYIPHVYQIFPDISGEVAPGAYQQGYSVAGANPVAAMPSLHNAIPWVLAMALWKYKGVRYVALVYAISMLFSIVYLGEHYAVDGFAGMATAAVGWVAATRLVAMWNARKLAQPSPEAAPVTVAEPAA